MPLLHLTLFDSLAFVLLALPFFIIAKILTQDWKFTAKEGLYIALACLGFALALTFHIGLRRTSLDLVENAMTLPALNMFGSAVLRTLLFLYFYRMKAYSVKKSLILMFLASMIGVSVEHLIGFVTRFFFPNFFDHYSIWQLVLYVLLIGLTVILSTFAFLRLSRNLRDLIAQDGRLQSILVGISVFILISIQILSASWHEPGDTLAHLSWNTLFLLGSILASTLGFFLYAKMLKQKLTILQKESEQRSLQYYIHQIEQQQTAMRKFKHDYQNILTSLYGFIQENNWEGLTQYYTAKIAVASEVITKNEFVLEGLSKIQVPEIKGILAAKLMLAQNLGIDTTFEATDEIDHIPMDSVALVRMLGIILDNAIEELETLGEGKLQVACYRVGASITFVTQNTCRSDMPKLHELRQTGFSTKGKGRGLGLSNLSEIANAYPNITLDTAITANKFVQKLTIGES